MHCIQITIADNTVMLACCTATQKLVVMIKSTKLVAHTAAAVVLAAARFAVNLNA